MREKDAMQQSSHGEDLLGEREHKKREGEWGDQPWDRGCRREEREEMREGKRQRDRQRSRDGREREKQR